MSKPLLVVVSEKNGVVEKMQATVDNVSARLREKVAFTLLLGDASVYIVKNKRGELSGIIDVPGITKIE